MRNETPKPTLSRVLPALLGLAGVIAGLGLPGLLYASQTIECDTPVLLATTPTLNAQLGWALSAGGDWLAAGANQDRANAGSVALYLNPEPGARPTVPELRPADLQPGDQFGSAVSLRGDWLAVGAPLGDGKVQDSGVVYLFQLVPQAGGPRWVQAAKLEAGDAARGAQLGFSVALSGTTLIVGAPGDSDGGSVAGAAYVFELQSGVWNQTAKLLASDRRPSDKFGSAVAIDGNEIVVGAPFAADLTALKSFGAAYVFKRAASGWALENQGKLTAGAFRAGTIQFGAAVAIGEGRIAVGAPGDDNRGLTDSGSAYVFERQGGSRIRRQLKPNDAKAGVQFGTAVQIAGDRVLIGAPFAFDREGIERLGAAYSFEKSNAVWTQIFKILHTPGGAFGQSVAALHGRVFLGGFQFTPVDGPADSGAVATCPSGTPPPPPPAADLSCVKTGPETAEPGGTVTYEITAGNDGGQAAQGVTLEDPDPANLHFSSATAPCSGGFPCALGTIAAGQTLPPVQVTFNVDVPLDCSAAGLTVENVATVGGAQCTAQTRIVPPEADLALVVGNVVPPAPVACGSSFSFTLTASNLGTAVAKGAVVDVTAAGALSLTSSEPGCVPVAGPQPRLLCSGLPDLTPGGPGHSITFSAQAPACGSGCAPVTINATVRSGNTCDRNPQNDGVIQVIPVACTPTADLAITKTHEPAALASGQAMAYVLTVRNNGPNAVTGATITDPLPNALLGPHCVGANATDCMISGNQLTITLGLLPVGGQAIYRIEGQLTSQCVINLSNTATVAPPPGIVDPDLSNNTATDTAAVPAPPGLSILCSGVSGAFVGDFVTFSYVLSNGGPNAQGDNPGAEFTDTLPVGLSLITATASSGTVTTAANTVTWNGSIPVCGTVTINVQAKVDPGTIGMILCNQGNVAFDANGDGVNESNKSALCCLTVNPDCITTPCIPTLGPEGLAALVLLLACVALLRLRRRSL